MARPIGWEQDEELSTPGSEVGHYVFDDGTKKFGVRSQDMDDLLPPEDLYAQEMATGEAAQLAEGVTQGPPQEEQPNPFELPHQRQPAGSQLAEGVSQVEPYEVAPPSGPVDLGDASGTANGAPHGEVPVGDTGLTMSVDTTPGPPGGALDAGSLDPEQAEIEEYSRQGLAQIEQESAQRRAKLQADVDAAKDLAQAKKIESDEQYARQEMAREQGRQRAAEAAKREHEEKLLRYQEEREAVQQSDVQGEFSDDALGSIIGIIGAVVAGAIGDQQWGKFIDKRINASAKQKIAERNSKLDTLANRLGSEKQAIAEYKAQAWNAVQKRLEAEARLRNVDLAKSDRAVTMAMAKQAAAEAEDTARRASYEKGYKLQEKGEQRDYDRGQDSFNNRLKGRAANRADRALDLQEARDNRAANAASSKVADKPSMRAGLDLNIPVGQEGKDAATRNAYAAQFNERDTKDAGSMTAYAKNRAQVAGLKETLNNLAHAYKVQPDKNGNYPKDSDTYSTGATGPALTNNPDFGLFDSEETRALKDYWTKVEENTRMQWKAEPNGEVAQQKFQMVGVPKRDADVGTKLNELRQVIRRLEQESGAAAGAHVRAAYDKRANSPFTGTAHTGIRPVPEEETR